MSKDELIALLKSEQHGSDRVIGMLMFMLKQDLSKQDLEHRINIIINEFVTDECRLKAECISFDIESHHLLGFCDEPLYL